MITRFLFSLFFSFLLPANLLFAAPEIDYHLEPKKLVKGQEAVFDITASWIPSEENYVFMFPKFETEGLQIKKQGESQESFIQDGKTWLQKKFTLIIMADGTKKPAKIKPFLFVFLDPKSAAKSEHPFSEIVIPIVINWQPVFLWLIMIAVIAASLFFFIHHTSKKKKAVEATAIQNAQEEGKYIRRIENIIASIESSETANQALKEIDNTLRQDLAERGWIPADKIRAGTGQIIDILASQEKLDKNDKEWLNRIFSEIERLKFTGAGISAFDVRNTSREVLSFLERHRAILR